MKGNFKWQMEAEMSKWMRKAASLKPCICLLKISAPLNLVSERAMYVTLEASERYKQRHYETHQPGWYESNLNGIWKTDLRHK